jgi:hypothetical protein
MGHVFNLIMLVVGFVLLTYLAHAILETIRWVIANWFIELKQSRSWGMRISLVAIALFWLVIVVGFVIAISDYGLSWFVAAIRPAPDDPQR